MVALYRVKDIKAIETVQRKFTKRLNGLQYKSYAERLLATNLESLQERRIKSDLIFAYKILFGYVDIDSRELLVPCLNSHNTRGHAFKLTVPPARVDARKFLFSNRVIPVWNNLPTDTDFTSLTNFKKFIRRTQFECDFNRSLEALFPNVLNV